LPSQPLLCLFIRRGLRRKPTNWLFPGNRWHTANYPVTTKVLWTACQRAALPRCRAGWTSRSVLRLRTYCHLVQLVPQPALPTDHARCISSRHSFFIPVKVLSRVFRGKFVAQLKDAFREARIEFHGRLAPLAEPRTCASWLRLLFRQDGVVYAKPPFGGPEHVLPYLGAYTHRVAISNHRLLALADGKVSFRWRDSAHGNRKRIMSLPGLPR
jgi:hypothetical protein